MNSNWNWNHLIFGAVIAIGGVAYAYYKQKTKATLSFPDYCSECESAAEKELSLIDDNIKTILVLAKVDDQNVAPFCIRAAKTEKSGRSELCVRCISLICVHRIFKSQYQKVNI